MQALDGARCGRGESGAEDDRVMRARREVSYGHAGDRFSRPMNNTDGDVANSSLPYNTVDLELASVFDGCTTAL